MLIANRGEIAIRVIKACRALGIKSVAVYSEADQGAPHTLAADEAVCIGPSPALESYLKIENLIEVCKKHRIEAVHPGYGFLSESPQFAQRCAEEDIAFVGAPAEVMRTMGDKMAGRNHAQSAGVPVLAGSDTPIALVDAASSASAIGFPILIKAAAGGGGMGIQIANTETDLQEAIERASSVSQKSFSDDRLYMERYLQNASHVEVQVFGDGRGNAVHMFERDCSVQRRNQKLIEETPCPKHVEERITEVCATAVRLAKSVNYSGAGTVEYLMSPAGEFFFIEMNTRIQVEHRITEAVTGLDLVAMQFRIAAGEEALLEQESITRDGYSMEARILAEDANTLMPSPGRITRYQEPHGEGITVDSGVCEGFEVSLFYDSLMCKLVATGKSREEARLRLLEGLRNFVIEGVDTNINLLIAILSTQEFISGHYDTKIVASLQQSQKASSVEAHVAALVAGMAISQGNRRISFGNSSKV